LKTKQGENMKKYCIRNCAYLDVIFWIEEKNYLLAIEKFKKSIYYRQNSIYDIYDVLQYDYNGILAETLTLITGF
jgi:hypothetical protein